jgi:DNA polymerase
MKRLHIDIETYSPEPIAKTGLYRYAFHEDFRILLFAYAADDGPVQIVDLAQGEALPERIVNALFDEKVTKVAHNATFERVCLSVYLWQTGTRQKGYFLPAEQWHCTMVQASRCGLPMSLKEAGAALGLEQQKMTEGKNLIKLFCVPKDKKVGGIFYEGDRNLPEDFPEEWETFKAYCVRDVEVERQIDEETAWLNVPSWERQLYAVDQRINDRGVKVDVKLAQEACRVGAIITARLTEEAMKLTGLNNPNSVTQLKDWLSAQLGIDVDTLSKKDLPEFRKITGDKRVLRVLDIRSQLGKSSNAKYEAMLACICEDDRVRGLLQFQGARTGRWAGRLVQLQNLPQNHIPDLDFARQALKDGDLEMLELGYKSVPDTLSQLIRTAFIPGRGWTFAVCDFSAIEARVLAWLAGEQWVLDVFAKGGDIYCATASQMFHKPVEKHGQNAELRQKGKIAVLALGYGGGVAALDAMGGQKLGMTEQEEKDTVDRWRKANPNIVRFWSDVEKGALAVIQGFQKTARLGIRVPISAEDYESRKAAANGREVRAYSVRDSYIEFSMHEGWLVCRLPSGRKITWPEAQVTVNRFGSESVRYKGVNQKTNKWGWLETFGGKLVENITQAVARDCLAHVLLQLDPLRGIHINTVFHVHDEVVCEVINPDRLKMIEEVFAKGPSWAEGLPLKGAGYTGPYYFKD